MLKKAWIVSESSLLPGVLLTIRFSVFLPREVDKEFTFAVSSEKSHDCVLNCCHFGALIRGEELSQNVGDFGQVVFSVSAHHWQVLKFKKKG